MSVNSRSMNDQRTLLPAEGAKGTGDTAEHHELAPSGPAGPPVLYQISVAPPPLMKVHLGDADSFGRYVATRDDATAAVWNESGVRVLLRDQSHILTYQPEVTEEAAQFFKREEKRHAQTDGAPGPKVWEGDFEPVQFTRAKLRRFLEAHATNVPEDVVRGLARLKLDTMEVESDEEDGYAQVRSQRSTFPKEITVNLELMPGTSAQLKFETRICSMDGQFGRRSGVMGIELRCVNARDVLRDAMNLALSRLPPELPRYYGVAPAPSERIDRGGYY